MQIKDVKGNPVKEGLDISDLLQQTIDQTALFTTHNIVDYLVGYIVKRNDYEENKKNYDEIITVIKKMEKMYEDKANGKDNSKVNSDNSK
jgi:trimethylamine:corrinoid methyltransferase-like protein